MYFKFSVNIFFLSGDAKVIGRYLLIRKIWNIINKQIKSLITIDNLYIIL